MYNQSDKQIKSILDVWKIIELSTPPKNETLSSYFAYAQKHATQQREFYKEINKKEALFLLQDAPFEKFNKDKLKAELPDYDICVHWHLYLSYLNWTEAEIAIEEKINELFSVRPKILHSPKNRKNPVLTPVVALTLDEDMNLIDNSVVISTGAYVLGKVVREGFSENDFEDLIEFEDNSAALIVNALKDSFDKTGQQKKFNLERVNYIANFIINELKIDGKFLLSNPEICVRKITYRKLRKNEKTKNAYTNQKVTDNDLKEDTKKELDWAPAPALEMFNSFFLKPLDLVRNNIDKFTENSSITKYLGANDKPDIKDVLNEPLLFKELLEPSKMQFARWPSSPKNCLAALQTAAINTILQKTENTEHIFAVNGPPGTGKTTLLFDIIANIYVKRALNLAKLKTPDEGFNDDQHCFKVAGFEYKIKALVPSLQNHEIVIASSNNNAVENISKELPLYAKIDKIYHDELKFFDWLVNDTDKNTNWGIFTAVLGRSANRQSFMEKFWKPEFPKEHEGYKCKTMFQYLNLLKGKAEAHSLNYLMPKYCNSYIDTKEEWQKECLYFNELYQEILKINDTIEKVITLNKQKSDLLKDYPNKDLLAILNEYVEEIKNFESTLKYIDSKIQEFDYEIGSVSLGFLKPIHTFFKTKRYNNFVQNNLRLIRSKNEQLELKEKIKSDIKKLQDKSKQLKLDIEKLTRIEEYLSVSMEFLISKNFAVTIFNDNDFEQNYSTDYDAFHKITPYFNQEVEKLRSKLFIQASKLHEIFINANARNFWDSLSLFSEIMNGKFSNIEPDMWKAVWQNFFMIVPVVSTTFHSFDNMFKNFSHNDLAWLIIDEAGQTPPQYAASAIYKSKNVIVVGDPMQTAPISILGQALIDKLCQKLKVDYSAWSPSEVSVQHLADRNSLYQTRYGNISVGFPLLVHRRCQSPMFDICNKIAYDNKMISAAPKPDSYLRTILKKSRWIDVQDDHTKKSHYESEAEFQELFKLLKSVFAQDNCIQLLNQIYIITMYKNYSSYIKFRLEQEARKLKIENKVGSFCISNIGTIHAFQGKEADTVIMVLGAQHPEDWGARSVMTDKSNVLNVGISRAKNNLYVIGNLEIWLKHKYMPEIYNMLGDKDYS